MKVMRFEFASCIIRRRRKRQKTCFTFIFFDTHIGKYSGEPKTEVRSNSKPEFLLRNVTPKLALI